MLLKKIYIVAGILIMISYITSATLFFMANSKDIFSDNIISVSLFLLSSFFLFILFFRLASSSSKDYERRTTEEFDKKQVLTEKDGTELNIETIADKTNLTAKAKEIGEKLFIHSKKDSPEKLAQDILSAFAKELNIVQGLFFMNKKDNSKFSVIASYAYYSPEPPKDFNVGEGISGQAAKDQKILNINNIPEGYITVLSGLGSTTPRNLLIVPIVYKGETIAVFETASFEKFPEYIKQVCTLYQDTLGQTFEMLLSKK